MPDGARDFYVGHAPALPAAEARVVRRALVALVLLVLGAPLALLAVHEKLAPATFEFGVVRRFRGTLVERPVPALLLERPDATATGDVAGAVSTLLIVAPGKHGAADLVRGRDGETVELRGTLVYRHGGTMIEVVPDSLFAVAGTPRTVATVDLGAVTLRGEIVDAKCHLGVMNPGDGKTHRGCAARCISGGIPPALRVRDAAGAERVLLLVGPAGEPVGRDVLDVVGEPVEVRGRAEQRGDVLVLYADPHAIRRLGEED